MSLQKEIKDCITSIQKAFKSNSFEPYIKYIRFPFYKNIENDQRITFDFPFTVFTGLNGSGKSSALHALYGSPKGYSTSDFWFSTNIDPISDSGNPSCFIYGYNNPSLVEVLKQRTGLAKGGDYWEPQPPAKKYKMIGSDTRGRKRRTPPINKNVVYIDFREQLSAFDKYFYFGKFNPTKTLSSKQDVLRKYSEYIKNNINNSGKRTFSYRKVTKNVRLTDIELNAVCSILGKDYLECHLLYHNFYDGVNGVTIYFITNNLKYTEAYAGRGEFAIAKLVHEVSQAPNNSLVILDEPEVSLHPGAQEALKLFLLRQTLIKKLQIVISTHSPKIVENLPDNAIKLFYENTNSRFCIKNSCNFLEAFQNIGIEITDDDKSIIIVEDIIAQLLITKIIKELGAEYELLFSVKFFPGGAEQMYKKGVVYSEENETHKFILLDGDKRKPKFSTKDFTSGECKDINFIENKLKEATNIDFKNLGFRIDGGQAGGDLEQKIKSSINYLDFIETNLEYLPLNNPEEIIWDEEFVKVILNSTGKNITSFTTDFKHNINSFAESVFGDVSSSSINSARILLIDNFIKNKNSNFNTIKLIINHFKSLIE